MNQQPVVLCADDYAISHAVCDGILSLAEQRRLSAASAIVTNDVWPARAAELVAQRERIALGLHVNLTHGAPLGDMPAVAPDGVPPPIGRLVARSFTGRLPLTEIRAEIDRQLQSFAQAAGPPDFVDGHQHVHVLPGIRGALLAALAERFPGRHILLRDPGDRLAAIVKRGSAVKAIEVKLLSAGYPRQVRRAGFTTNTGFSGYSDFGPEPYDAEFERYLIDPGTQHLIMCHPGREEPELARHGGIAAQRPQELDFLSQRAGLAELLWHPDRAVTGDQGAFATGDAS